MKKLLITLLAILLPALLGAASGRLSADDFNPENPENPGANYWDAFTGEMILDDYNPEDIQQTITKLLGSSSVSSRSMPTMSSSAPWAKTIPICTN